MATMTTEEAKMNVIEILKKNGWSVMKTGPAFIEAKREDGQQAIFYMEIITGEPEIVPGKKGMPGSIWLQEDPNFVGVQVQVEFVNEKGERIGQSDKIRLDGGSNQALFEETLHATA